jgi:hypothetical protein
MTAVRRTAGAAAFLALDVILGLTIGKWLTLRRHQCRVTDPDLAGYIGAPACPCGGFVWRDPAAGRTDGSDSL